MSQNNLEDNKKNRSHQLLILKQEFLIKIFQIIHKLIKEKTKKRYKNKKIILQVKQKKYNQQYILNNMFILNFKIFNQTTKKTMKNKKIIS